MWRTCLISVTAALAILLVTTSTAFGNEAPANPFIGTWVLDVGKSKFEGTPPLKSYTITITDAGAGKLHDVADWVNGDGSKGHIEYTASLDGKEGPVTGYPNADSVRLTAVNSHSLKLALSKGGKSNEWGTYKVAADGKTMHAVEGGTDETGATYHYVELFERK